MLTPPATRKFRRAVDARGSGPAGRGTGGPAGNGPAPPAGEPPPPDPAGGPAGVPPAGTQPTRASSPSVSAPPAEEPAAQPESSAQRDSSVSPVPEAPWSPGGKAIGGSPSWPTGAGAARSAWPAAAAWRAVTISQRSTTAPARAPKIVGTA